MKRKPPISRHIYAYSGPRLKATVIVLEFSKRFEVVWDIDRRIHDQFDMDGIHEKDEPGFSDFVSEVRCEVPMNYDLTERWSCGSVRKYKGITIASITKGIF